MTFQQKINDLSNSIIDSLRGLTKELEKNGMPLKREDIINQTIRTSLLNAADQGSCTIYSSSKRTEYGEYLYESFIAKVPFHILSLNINHYLTKYIKYWYNLSINKKISPDDDPIYIIAVIAYIDPYLQTIQQFTERTYRERKAATESSEQRVES